jgi:hypothetical protein
VLFCVHCVNSDVVLRRAGRAEEIRAIPYNFLRALAKKKCNFCGFNGVLVLVRYDKVIAHCEPFLLAMAF